jgi:hypothetical protein
LFMNPPPSSLILSQTILPRYSGQIPSRIRVEIGSQRQGPIWHSRVSLPVSMLFAAEITHAYLNSRVTHPACIDHDNDATKWSMIDGVPPAVSPFKI